MNLYLFLALALGAVSAVPPAQPHATTVVTERSARTTVSVVGAACSRPNPRGSAAGRRPALHVCLSDAPLTGAATPRAPASSR